MVESGDESREGLHSYFTLLLLFHFIIVLS